MVPNMQNGCLNCDFFDTPAGEAGLMKTMINTIIFDFGGVMGTDSDPIFFEVLAKHGVSKKTSLEIWEKHWKKMEIDNERVDAIWNTVKKYTTSDIKNISNEYYELIAVNQEMIELCEKLKQKGYKLGMLANETYEWMNIKRQKGNLDKLFDVVYSSADLKSAKPEKKAYLKTLGSLKAKPEETIFIDDRERNVLAAEKLGIKSFVFKDIEQLKKDLSKINII